MMSHSKIIVAICLLALALLAGCQSDDTKGQEEYEKCTSVCASVLEGDFVTMELCRQECKEKFLEKK